jgi:hypothetical protein
MAAADSEVDDVGSESMNAFTSLSDSAARKARSAKFQ